MSIRAVTFDFWNTLFGDQDGTGARRSALRIEVFQKAVGVSVQEAEAAHKAMGKAFLKHHIEEQRTLRPEDAVRMMCAHCQISLDEEAAANLAVEFARTILDAPPDPLPGAAEAVRETAKHAPIGIISDSGISPGSSLRILLERAGMLEHFTATIFSDEVGVAKPQRPMFTAAAEGLRVSESDLLHLGDLEPTDIAGAISAGANAGLYTGYHDKYLAETQAHHHFADWETFLNRLPHLLTSPA